MSWKVRIFSENFLCECARTNKTPKIYLPEDVFPVADWLGGKRHTSTMLRNLYNEWRISSSGTSSGTSKTKIENVFCGLHGMGIYKQNQYFNCSQTILVCHTEIILLSICFQGKWSVLRIYCLLTQFTHQLTQLHKNMANIILLCFSTHELIFSSEIKCQIKLKKN